jgi:hypothetical protein
LAPRLHEPRHAATSREDRYATLREKPGPSNAFRVTSTDDDKAILQPVDDHFRAVGEQTTAKLEALVRLARFGDPIFPGLVCTGEVLGAVDEDGKPTKPFHTVINGENFYALETLLYAYEGKVDCIYCSSSCWGDVPGRSRVGERHVRLHRTRLQRGGASA